MTDFEQALVIFTVLFQHFVGASYCRDEQEAHELSAMLDGITATTREFLFMLDEIASGV